MTGSVDAVGDVTALVRRNEELDRALRELVAQISDETLRADPGDGEWTLAENLGHLSEFPRYFAREIVQTVLTGADASVGRTHEHPERNEAIAAAAGKSCDQLSGAVHAALAEMSAAIRLLSDDDLRRVVANRKYGNEPMTAYLQRYVLGHKAAHVEQLRRTLAVVTG